MQFVWRYLQWFVLLTRCILLLPAQSFAFEAAYVLKPKVNMRRGPGIDHETICPLLLNTSLYCLEKHETWTRVATAFGQSGWVRNDFISSTAVLVFQKEQELAVVREGITERMLPISPGKAGLPLGRYFASSAGNKRFLLTWPNRADLRAALAAGTMTMQDYEKAVVAGKVSVGSGMALCSEANVGSDCGAIVSRSDFSRLSALIPRGARVEIYRDAQEAVALNRPDELSYQIYLGAEKQLKYPAAGLRPGARLPELSYPGGDIQPDFAASTDIVIRAVRYAGVDLQALVHEDMLLHPERYEGVDSGGDPYGAHRCVPVLFAYLSSNALSLPTDVDEDLLGFESGDIIFLSSGSESERVPDRVGIVSETYDNTRGSFGHLGLGHGAYLTDAQCAESQGADCCRPFQNDTSVRLPVMG